MAVTVDDRNANAPWPMGGLKQEDKYPNYFAFAFDIIGESWVCINWCYSMLYINETRSDLGS